LTTRILYIVSSLDRYGAESQLALLAASLPRSQFDVHLCCLEPPQSKDAFPPAAGVSVTHAGQRWPLDPLAALRLERLLHRLRPDVVHTGCFHSGAYGRLAALVADRAHLVAGEPVENHWPPWHRLALGRLLASKTRAIVVPHAAVRDYFVRQGWPAEKFVVIPPAVAPAASSQLARGELLAQIGLPADAHLIGVVGRLEIEEGWKEVIWTLDILRCVRDDLHMLVVGDGRQRGQLERFVRLCTMEPNVHFLGRRPDLAQLLPHFNHLWQGGGSGITAVAVLEALAAGVPVVAANTAGNRELVLHDQTGFLVPIRDRAGRSRYANRLINDPGLRARLGEAGRQRMTSRFNVEQMVARHVDLYQRVCGGCAPA
jgi:glycosyltransferase involved in cell wall biosynthesis